MMLFPEETTVGELVDALYLVLNELEEKVAERCMAMDGGVRLAQALFELDCTIDRVGDALGVESGSELASRRAHPTGRHFKGRGLGNLTPILPN